MDTNGAVTLYQIIKDFQHITGRQDRDYYRLFNLAVMCMRDLNMFATNKVKTKKVNLKDIDNNLGIIQYPDDAIGIYGLFYNYNGTLYPLTDREDMIYTTSETDDGEEYQNEDIGEGVVLDSARDRKFATRGAQNEFYYYDDKNQRRIVINGTGDVWIWIQYISSGVDSDGGENTLLPVYFEEAIHNYILYREAVMQPHGQKKMIPTYFNEYKKSKNKIKTFEMPSLEQFRDALYSVWRRTPKR